LASGSWPVRPIHARVLTNRTVLGSEVQPGLGPPVDSRALCVGKSEGDLAGGNARDHLSGTSGGSTVREACRPAPARAGTQSAPAKPEAAIRLRVRQPSQRSPSATVPLHPETSGSNSGIKINAPLELEEPDDTVRANKLCGVTGVVSAAELLLLVLAGLGAGLVGSIAGLASLISYPALLAIGLPPVMANVTNTVALVFSSGGSALSSRPELSGQAPRLLRLGVVAVLGGVIGGLLLLITPPGAFQLMVPWLIALASMAILVQRRPQEDQHLDRAGHPIGLTVGVFLVAVYGGYFGAAAGVLMLALLLASTREGLARSNAVKNAVLGLANATAAVTFVLFSSVHWSLVAPLALGCFAGGRLGPLLVRHAPAGPLRIAIAVAGMGLAIHLGIAAYR
jgi:uncharacterized membrane protein YfcA